jgi:hypothetical protein
MEQLDEPAAMQSDPTVLELLLRNITRKTDLKPMQGTVPYRTVETRHTSHVTLHTSHVTRHTLTRRTSSTRLLSLLWFRMTSHDMT